MSRSQCMRILLGVTLLACCAPAWSACSVNVIGVNFGAYDVFDSLDMDITGSIGITCDTPTIYSLSLSAGSGTYVTRTMVGMYNVFNYNLYLDPERVTVWGDGSEGTSTLNDNGISGTYPVYGRIPARQNAYMGNYADTIIVTLSY